MNEPFDAAVAQTTDRLSMPCNVIVYETRPSTTVVAAMAPLAALSPVGDNPELGEVGEAAQEPSCACS